MADKGIKIGLFLILFLFSSKFAFAFDAWTSHPDLTQEIVKFYNSYSSRKITDDELQLLKLGSTREDDSPRWLNHFYDPIHNTGLNIKYFRGSPPLKFVSWSTWLKTLAPLDPIPSIRWVKDEDYQIAFNTNRTFQKAIRDYFINKKSAFISLGHALHLLEDLGVPDHSRGDGHSGFGEDKKSPYEEFAKDISEKYKLTFADELIQKNEQPKNFSSLEEIFNNMAIFTANNFFSEDTINNDFTLPDIQPEKFLSVSINQKDAKLYFKNNPSETILLCFESDCTVSHIPILRYWLKTTYPEIIKHGAALIDLYFAEVKKLEQDQTMLDIENLQARDRRVSRLFKPFKYLSAKKFIWRQINPVVNLYTNINANIKSLFNKTEKEALPDYLVSNTKKIIPSSQNNPTKEQQQESGSSQPYQEIRSDYIERRGSFNTAENINRIANVSNASNASLIKKESDTQSQNDKATTTNPNPDTTKSSTNDRNQSADNNPSSSSQPPKLQLTQKVAPASAFGGSSENPKNPCDNLKNKTFPKLLISEIQFESEANTKDEYIEIYNPNTEAVELKCWELQKYAAKSSDDKAPTLTTLVPTSKFIGTIQPFGFFLISHPEAQPIYGADLSYTESYSIAKNNVIILKNPAGLISDLVGYGDQTEKVYQAEIAPFLAINYLNRSIQRKNLTDSDNNQRDFWLRKPTPENSRSTPRQPREDFVDLTNLTMATPTAVFDEELSKFSLTFTEPNLSIPSTNYSYLLTFKRTSTTEATSSIFNLTDFGSTSALPTPQFKQATLTFQTDITKCPATDSLYILELTLIDNLDIENHTSATTSFALSQSFCNPQEEQGRATKYHGNDNAGAAQLGKVVISEVMLSGTSTKDEYIELYNPNPFPVNLNGWSLIRYNKSGVSQTILPSSKFKGVIKPFSFFLITNATSTYPTSTPDLIYASSYNLAKDNAILLQNATGETIDLVGWGKAQNFEGEVFPENPKDFEVIQRKAGFASTKESLELSAELGGEKEFGNNLDSNNNKFDFVLTNPDPQNSDIEEIPPVYPIRVKISKAEDDPAAIKLKFTSPYLATTTGLSYELRYDPDGLIRLVGDRDILVNSRYLLLAPSSTMPLVRTPGYSEEVKINFCNTFLPATSKSNFFFLFMKNDVPIQFALPEKIGDLSIDVSNCPGKILYSQTDNSFAQNTFCVFDKTSLLYRFNPGHTGQLGRIKIKIRLQRASVYDGFILTLREGTFNNIASWNFFGYDIDDIVTLHLPNPITLNPEASYELAITKYINDTSPGAPFQIHLYFYGTKEDKYDKGELAFDGRYYDACDNHIETKDIYFKLEEP